MNGFRSARVQYLVLAGLLLAGMLLASVGTARADVGPKPSMEFEFESESGEPFTIVSGVQFECDAPDCSDAEPLMEAGPQRFTCDETTCSSLAYGYADYHQISITLADGRVLESNIFEKRAFGAKFKVTIRSTDLLVEEAGGGWASILVWCLVGLCCLVVPLGLVIALVIFFVRRRPASKPG